LAFLATTFGLQGQGSYRLETPVAARTRLPIMQRRIG